ncbi:unnamed protein product, partial [Laminaria digitata]
YRGREDGWLLTANKRGPTAAPTEGGATAAAKEFDTQEASYAATAAATAAATEAPVSADGANRPLTGAKPPQASSEVVAEEDRPLSGGVGGKGAWVPPSEFP